MANIPSQVAAGMKAQGKPVPVNLLEVQTPSGWRFFFSDAPIVAPSLLAQFDGEAGATGVAELPYTGGFPIAGPPVTHGGTFLPHYVLAPPEVGPSSESYLAWLIEPPPWTFTGTLTTPTSSCTIQNLSGDSVERDLYKQFAARNLWGSIFISRIWLPDAEYALLTVKGNVTDAHIDDTKIDLQLRSMSNWSEIPAPDCTVDVNCGNIFGSQQCGSIAATPCQNTYGSCSAVNRFKAVITQWSNGQMSSSGAIGVAQPVPIASANLRRSA